MGRQAGKLAGKLAGRQASCTALPIVCSAVQYSAVRAIQWHAVHAEHAVHASSPVDRVQHLLGDPLVRGPQPSLDAHWGLVGDLRQRQVLVAGPDLSERLHLGAHLVFT